MVLWIGFAINFSVVRSYQTDYSNHVIARQWNFYASAFNDEHADGSRSASPSSGPTGPISTRCLSRILDHPMPTPILNVRLVGYTDNMTKSRGSLSCRQMCRGPMEQLKLRMRELLPLHEIPRHRAKVLFVYFCAIELFIQLTFIVRLLRSQLALSNFVMSGLSH